MARELARIVLPINLYTEWYWKIDLHNLFHFLELRLADNAQYEIREYATQISEIVALWVPKAYQAFLDYRVNSVQLSALQVKVLRAKLEGKEIDQTTSGLSVRRNGVRLRVGLNENGEDSSEYSSGD